MTEITQADRDAAQALCASGWTHAMAAFAKHRESERAAIVAWLRDGGQLRDFNGIIARAIEAGEHHAR